MKKIKSLYIHIPFCKSICFYCNFSKMIYFSSFAKKYLKELIKELRLLKIKNKLKTIYIGGGTPTCVNLKSLLVELQPYINKNTEFTIEGDILDFNEKLLIEYKKYHVNRVSLGIQSTNDEILKLLGRKHTRSDIFEKIKLIKKFFSNINVDLIYGLNILSEKKIISELNDYVKLKVKHISTYCLEINEGTVFFNKHKKQLDDNLARKQFDIIYYFLIKKGYCRYETSNFAKKKYESKHNLVYWKNEKYYGIGLSSASFNGKERIKNTSSLNNYLKGKYILEKEKITKKENLKYYLMLNLRLTSGINLKEMKQIGYDLLSKKEKEIKELVKQNLLKINKNNLCTTYEGSMLLDLILRKLF